MRGNISPQSTHDNPGAGAGAGICAGVDAGRAGETGSVTVTESAFAFGDSRANGAELRHEAGADVGNALGVLDPGKNLGGDASA